MKKSNILVTGAEGFVGKHLVDYLEQNGYSTIKPRVDLTSDISIIRRAYDQLQFNYIIHLAALSYVPESFKDPYKYYNNNFKSTVNIMELARHRGCPVIHFSSYLYGHPEYLPIDEVHPIKPHNPYASSKLVSENIVIGYSRDYQIPCLVLRPFNIYGPGQNESFLIPKLISQIRKGEILIDDLRPKRDFVFINDVINMVTKALGVFEGGIEICNIASGNSISVADLIAMILKIMKKDVNIQCTHRERQNDILDIRGDYKHAFNLFGWTPQTELFDGLTKVIYR